MDPDDDIGTLETTAGGIGTLETTATPTARTDATLEDGVREAGAERYRLGPMLGKGGMGEVVSAHDEQLGRWVAVKRLRADRADGDLAARFVREARIQARLDHPAIVPVHELWTDEEGRPCFAMKQLAGRTLVDVIEKLAAGDAATQREFTVQRLLSAFADVCLAIEFAHTRGVVHRDLKPSNIQLGDFGEVYVLDWGIARVLGADVMARPSFPDLRVAEDDRTSAGAIVGTPGYMSPEQIHGDPDLDGRADVYALGCMLFEMLARSPLHPRSREGIATALEGDFDARPSQRAPSLEIAPELDALCVAATASQRGDRTPTARALGQAVQRYLDGDRDVAMRRDIATKELAAAKDAVARGDGPGERRDAMVAAGRALAFAPDNRETAALIAQLMLRPPAEEPPEVARALAEADLSTMHDTRWSIALGGIGYLVFIPLLFIAGFREPWYHVVTGALGLTLVACGALSSRAQIQAAGTIAVVCALGLVAVFSHIFSFALVAPALGALTAMLIATHPVRLINTYVLYALTVVAILAPGLPEIFGASKKLDIAGGDIVIRTGVALDPTVTRAMLVLFVFQLTATGIVLARTLVAQRRRAERSVQLQAWQLRQLVPPPAA